MHAGGGFQQEKEEVTGSGVQYLRNEKVYFYVCVGDDLLKLKMVQKVERLKPKK